MSSLYIRRGSVVPVSLEGGKRGNLSSDAGACDVIVVAAGEGGGFFQTDNGGDFERMNSFWLYGVTVQIQRVYPLLYVLVYIDSFYSFFI